MKYIKTIIPYFVFIISLFAIFQISKAEFEIPGSPTIYTENESEILNSDNLNNPIRDGAYKMINAQDDTQTNKIGGITNNEDQITSHKEAESQVMQIIKNVINYALGLLSLISLVYLIYHGFLMITAAGDDTQYKKGLKGLKFAAIALAGIGLSWIVISFIFYIIQGLRTDTLNPKTSTQAIQTIFSKLLT